MQEGGESAHGGAECKSLSSHDSAQHNRCTIGLSYYRHQLQHSGLSIWANRCPQPLLVCSEHCAHSTQAACLGRAHAYTHGFYRSTIMEGGKGGGVGSCLHLLALATGDGTMLW